MRGRIFAVASSCSGRPLVLDRHRHDGVGAVPPAPRSRLTLPTSTPAIRTGESGRSPFDDVNTALTWYGARERDVLGEPEEDEDRDHDEREQARRRTGERGRGGGAARAGHQGLPSVAACCVPGTFDGDRLALQVGLVARLALARLARRGRVRVRVRVQVVLERRPVGGRRGRAALVVRALRRGDDDEALPGPVACRPRTAARRCCGTSARCSCRSVCAGARYCSVGFSELHRVGQAAHRRAARAGPRRTSRARSAATRAGG